MPSKPRSRNNSTSNIEDILGDSNESERWALCFRNSSYDGEFAETLSLVLYRCPEIEFLSFVGNSNAALDDSGSLLLSYLIGYLPPTIGGICFENVMTKKSVEALGIMLKTNASDGNKQKNELNLKGLAVTHR